MGCPWSYPVLKSRCSIPATVMDVLSKMCGLLTFKVSRKPSSFHARNFVLCYQQNAMPSKSLNNVRPPSTLSAGACRAQSPLEGEPLPRRMKPDASPSVHDDIHLQIGCRGSERRRHSYGYLVSTHRVRRAEICNQYVRRQPLRRRGCQGQFEERKTHFARVSNVPQKEERLRFVSIIAPCSSPPGRRKVCRVVGDRTASCKGL